MIRSALRFLFVSSAIVLGSAIAGAQLPASKGAPKPGDKAPNFTLPDSTGKPFTLAHLFAGGKETDAGAVEGPAWVLLIFYRGYW